MILAGDIGGTKTNLAYFDVENGKLVARQSKSYASQEFPSLAAILKKFRSDFPGKLTASAFGIAGPVVNGHSHLTNLVWEIDREELKSELGVNAVELVNDLQATAYGTLHLADSEKLTLQSGRRQENGAIAVIAAGTGLGEGALVWDGKHYRAVASEGGHADFSPRNELESSLLLFLAKKFGHVSWERILSGPGIVSLYEFFVEQSGSAPPAWITAAFEHEDHAAVVSKAAMEGKDAACVKALDLFVSLYGSEAGNLFLKFLGTGGVFVGGGIAPKILAKLKDGQFVRNFRAKGRFDAMLGEIPISVILNDRIALVGAAHVARVLAES